MPSGVPDSNIGSVPRIVRESRVTPAPRTLPDETSGELPQDELTKPPLVWSSSSTDPLDQPADFRKWGFETKGLVPETHAAIMEWLGSEDAQIDTMVTHASTGARYHLVGTRDADGARCRIKFIGDGGRG